MWRRRRFKKVGMVVEIKVIRVTRRRVFSVLCVVEIGRWRSHSGGGYCSIFALSGCARVWIIFMILHDKAGFVSMNGGTHDESVACPPLPCLLFPNRSQLFTRVVYYCLRVLEPRFSTPFRLEFRFFK